MKITKDLIKYDIETAVITALEAKYKDVQITDGKSYAVVMAGLAEYRDLRLKIEGKHKELKKDALEYGRAVDAEKNRLKTLLEPGENHLKDIRQTEDDRKAAIKAEKEAKDRERVEKIRSKISEIQMMGGAGLAIVPLKDLRELSNKLDKLEINTDEYMEFTNEAKRVLDDTYDSVQLSIVTAIQMEKEEAERKAEAERLEKIRKEQEEAQKKINEENRKIEEEKAKIEREKYEQEVKENFEKAMKEKVEQKERERLEREEVESKERLRQESLKPDKEKLIKFAEELLDIYIPHVESTKGQEILSNARKGIEIITINIKDQANKL